MNTTLKRGRARSRQFLTGLIVEHVRANPGADRRGIAEALGSAPHGGLVRTIELMVDRGELRRVADGRWYPAVYRYYVAEPDTAGGSAF